MKHTKARALTISEHIFRFLLCVYPSEFRKTYGPHMQQVFEDRCREEFGKAGWVGMLRLWGHTCIDLFRSATVEHLEKLRLAYLPSMGRLLGLILLAIVTYYAAALLLVSINYLPVFAEATFTPAEIEQVQFKNGIPYAFILGPREYILARPEIPWFLEKARRAWIFAFPLILCLGIVASLFGIARERGRTQFLLSYLVFCWSCSLIFLYLPFVVVDRFFTGESICALIPATCAWMLELRIGVGLVGGGFLLVANYIGFRRILSDGSIGPWAHFRRFCVVLLLPLLIAGRVTSTWGFGWSGFNFTDGILQITFTLAVLAGIPAILVGGSKGRGMTSGVDGAMAESRPRTSLRKRSLFSSLTHQT